MAKVVSFDQEQDILVIHKGFSKDEKFKGNIDLGDIILDVSTQKRIRGIEILNASRFFKDFRISSDVLKHLSDAQFSADIKPGRIILSIVVKSKGSELPAKVAVPLQMPVCA